MQGVSIARRSLDLQSAIGVLEVVGLSPAGISFFAPLGVAAEPMGLVSLTLPFDPVPITAMIDSRGTDGELNATFVDLGIERARDIARLIELIVGKIAPQRQRPAPLYQERIVAPERIREVLHTAFANRCRGRIMSAAGGGRPIRIGAGRIEPHSKVPLQWECEEPWPSPPFTISIDGDISMLTFRVDKATEVDGFLAVEVPEELVRERARSRRRIEAPADTMITFDHPRWRELRIARRVREVSLDGLQLGCAAVKDLLYVGLRVPDATVVFQDRLLCRVGFEITHISDDVDGEAQVAGVRLEFPDDDERLHYVEKVSSLLHPNTRADATWTNQLWELYRASGYLELSHKTEPEFVALKQAFAETSTRVARSGLGVQVVWPSSRGLEASMSILRCYERGAFIYQLARRQGRVPLRFPGRKILRDVYLHAIEHMQRWDEVRWLIAWVQKEARFSRLMHVDMPRRYQEQGRTLLWRFRALEADVGGVAVTKAPPGVEISEATPSEIDRLLEHIAATRPQHYVEAHDLSPDTFDQRKLRRGWTEAGLHRMRRVAVARRGGKPIAVALCEAADDGLHLFRLLDVVRFYCLQATGEVAYPALLDEARRFYAEQGKARFIVFAEPDDMAPLASAPLTDLGEADAVLLPSDLWPELLEHVYEVTAPRDVPRLLSR